jgi:hypothetical protein
MSARHAFPYTTASLIYDPGPFRRIADSDLGRELWTFLTRPENVRALVIAVRLGAAPVSAISVDLVAAFGDGPPDSARDQMTAGIARRWTDAKPPSLDQVKRLIGHMIRQVLEAVGATVRTKNSPARDKTGLFTTSARYRWKTEEEP